MPVYKLVEEMSFEEFLGWLDFYKRRPEGWREDFRTARLMAAFGVDKKPHELFPALASMMKAQTSSEEPVQNNFAASGMMMMILSAKGGDKIPD